MSRQNRAEGWEKIEKRSANPIVCILGSSDSKHYGLKRTEIFHNSERNNSSFSPSFFKPIKEFVSWKKLESTQLRVFLGCKTGSNPK